MEVCAKRESSRGANSCEFSIPDTRTVRVSVHRLPRISNSARNDGSLSTLRRFQPQLRDGGRIGGEIGRERVTFEAQAQSCRAEPPRPWLTNAGPVIRWLALSIAVISGIRFGKPQKTVGRHSWMRPGMNEKRTSILEEWRAAWESDGLVKEQ